MATVALPLTPPSFLHEQRIMLVIRRLGQDVKAFRDAVSGRRSASHEEPGLRRVRRHACRESGRTMAERRSGGPIA
jgi:hypothetical protein